MLKFQIILIAILVCCFAFVSCERAQQVMMPAVDDSMSEEMKEGYDMTGDNGMMDDMGDDMMDDMGDDMDGGMMDDMGDDMMDDMGDDMTGDNGMMDDDMGEGMDDNEAAQ